MNRRSNLRQQRPNEKAFCVMKMMCLYAAHSILFARDMRHLTTILHLNSKNTGLPYLTSTLILLFLTNPFPLCHKMYVFFIGKKRLLLDTPSPLCGRPVWKPRNHHTIEASKYPLYFPYKITRVIFSYELYYKICTSSASHICKPSLNNLASERFGNLPNKATESLHFH